MFSEYIANHPKLVIIIIILSLIISGYYASQSKIGVDTGRFELKNEPYRVYNRILKTFGGEGDKVIIVGISRNGYILNRSDIISILNFETDTDTKIEEAKKVGDYETLCRYHISEDYCLILVKKLIDDGKIDEARRMIEILKEEGINLEFLLKSKSFNPRFE